jgi:hypothetical protein
MWAGVILTLLSGAGLAMAKHSAFDESDPDHRFPLPVGTESWNIQDNRRRDYDQAGKRENSAGAEILIWFAF